LDPPTSFCFCFDLSHPDAPRGTCVRFLFYFFFCFVCVILHPWRHAVVGSFHSFIHSLIHSLLGKVNRRGELTRVTMLSKPMMTTRDGTTTADPNTRMVRDAVSRGIYLLLGECVGTDTSGAPPSDGVFVFDADAVDFDAFASSRRAHAHSTTTSSFTSSNAAVTALTDAAMDKTIAERMARDVAKRAREALVHARTQRVGAERGARRACAWLGKWTTREDVADVRAVAIEQLRVVLGGCVESDDDDSDEDDDSADSTTHPMRAFYVRDADDADAQTTTRVSIEKVLADEEGFVAAVVDAFARLRIFFERYVVKQRNNHTRTSSMSSMSDDILGGAPSADGFASSPNRNARATTTEVQIMATTTTPDGRTSTKTFKMDASKSVVAKEKIERDLQTVRRWSEETSEAARRVVREWLAETQTIDAMRANLRRCVPDDRATMRQIQRRELLSHALASWGDLRSAVVALELGVEELKFCERRAKYYLDENEACYRRVSTVEDAESLDRLLLDELEGHRASFVAAAPNAREMEDRARACVLKIRAVNSCDATRGGSSGSMRKMTSYYPDGDMDVKHVLRDALDDVKASYRDLMDEFNDADDADLDDDSSLSALTPNANRRDATALYARIEPILNRYADTTLSRVIQRVVRALNREGAALTRGIDLARCAVFAHVFAGVAVAHAKAVDDELLESILREFEECDEEAARVKSAKAIKRRKSRTRKKEIRRMMTLQQEQEQQQKDDSPTDEKTPKEKNDDDDDDGEENENEPVVVIAAVVDKENIPPSPPTCETIDDGSDAGWTKARSRRKSSSSSPARGIKTPIPAPRVSATKTIPAPKQLPKTPSTNTVSPCPPVPPKPLPPVAAHPPLPPGPAPESAQASRLRQQPSVDDAQRPRTAIPPPRANFPPKPKTTTKTRPPLRSIAEYKRMLGTESESDRESRLKEFPALTSANGSTTPAQTVTATPTIPSVRKSSSSSLPVPRIVPPPPPPPRQKSWAEAKLSIDGVKLPSLIKIK
jgi:hypothetical protein